MNNQNQFKSPFIFNQHEVCICIPARYRSSRLPGKLMYLLGNKSCIQRTIEQCLPVGVKIFVLTDHQIIFDHVTKTFAGNDTVIPILADQPCKNGTERICRNLDKIPEHYKVIVNVQADEPFISSKNIKHSVQMYFNGRKDEKLHFYTTLHETIKPDTEENKKYLKSTASLTLETTLSNRVLSYTRNIIPWGKKGIIDVNREFKLFTGIYVFNRELLTGFHELPDTPLQLCEDIEQLKVLEHDYYIYSYPTVEYNEISLNDTYDLEVLCEKYKVQCVPHSPAHSHPAQPN